MYLYTPEYIYSCASVLTGDVEGVNTAVLESRRGKPVVHAGAGGNIRDALDQEISLLLEHLRLRHVRHGGVDVALHVRSAVVVLNVRNPVNRRTKQAKAARASKAWLQHLLSVTVDF